MLMYMLLVYMLLIYMLIISSSLHSMPKFRELTKES